MNATADQLLRKCERYLEAGESENARKCAKGLSILTGQPAWERAYQSILDEEDPAIHIQRQIIKIPEGLIANLHQRHRQEGKELANQSVRHGTQVNLTHDTEIADWLEHLTLSKLIGAWTTCLKRGGFHIPHIHPRGKWSHVIYLEVPDAKSGRIYFGQCRYAPQKRIHYIKPVPGLLLSFPCWLWHGVTQYTGLHPRLTLAFDTHG